MKKALIWMAVVVLAAAVTIGILVSQKNNVSASLTSLQSDFDALKAEYEQYQKDTEGKLTESQSANATLTDENAQNSQQVEALTKEKAALQATLDTANQTIETLKAENATLTSDKESLSASIKDAAAAAETALAAARDEAAAQVDAAKQEAAGALESAKQALTELEEKWNALKGEKEALEAQLAALSAVPEKSVTAKAQGKEKTLGTWKEPDGFTPVEAAASADGNFNAAYTAADAANLVQSLQVRAVGTWNGAKMVLLNTQGNPDAITGEYQSLAYCSVVVKSGDQVVREVKVFHDVGTSACLMITLSSAPAADANALPSADDMLKAADTVYGCFTPAQ